MIIKYCLSQVIDIDYINFRYDKEYISSLICATKTQADILISYIL